ncbi:hypothetical protein V2E99_005999 [Pseudomonas aeruginosa]
MNREDVAIDVKIQDKHPEQAGGDERKLSDLGNELHNLSCSIIHENEKLAEQIGGIARELWNWPQARAALAQPSPAQAEQPTADDYEEVLADHRRLVREMDVLLNGEACAAKQAMLCDLVSQVEAEVRKSGQPLLVSAERYRWLRNDDNWGADDSEGQGTSKWANLGELSGTDFDAYLDQLRGSNPVMDIDPEHSKAIAKRGRDAIVAQAEGAPVIGCLCGMPMTEGRHSPGGCTSLEEFAPHLSAQAQAKQAERPEVVGYRIMRAQADRIYQRVDKAAAEYEAGRSALGYMEDIAEAALCLRNRLDDLLAAAPTQAQHSVPEEFSFEYRHPNGESHTVTVSRDQVINEMPDFLFEALCSKFCNCEPVGETNVVECCCDEYAEEFKLLAAAPGKEGV